MYKPFLTLLLASLCCLPGSLFARTATPFAQPAQEENAFATWTPNQLQQTTDVNLLIYLPYSGSHNYFDLEFRSLEGGGSTYFSTNNAVAASNQLGSLPAGRYDLFYSAIYGPDEFFDVFAGCDYSSRYPRLNSGAVYGFTVSEDCNAIVIDKF